MLLGAVGLEACVFVSLCSCSRLGFSLSYTRQSVKMLNLFCVGMFGFILSLIIIVSPESLTDVDLFLAVIVWSTCSVVFGQRFFSSWRCCAFPSCWISSAFPSRRPVGSLLKH